MNDLVAPLAWYLVFLFSTTLHEAAHALAALRGGDPTAYQGGQVSIDPVPHIKRAPFGMVVIPIVSVFIMGWPLGFASAPYDPYWAQRHPKRAGLMALAGPGANLSLVLIAALIIWIGIFFGYLYAPEHANYSHVVASAGVGLWPGAASILSMFFTLNLVLFVFNMMPLPPLDGSTAITLLVSEETGSNLLASMANSPLGMIGILIAWQVFGPLFSPIFTLSLNILYPGGGYH